jgi:tetratricopeptide (TPR) repeat protein
VNLNSSLKILTRSRLFFDAGLILVLLAGMVSARGAATNDFFARGVEFSREGQFPEAAAAFAAAAKAQPAVGTLVNLGLAEWQRGHAGTAILAWEQASWINPFDARAAANLKFARQVAQVDAPPLKWQEIVSTWLPPNVWAWLACVMLCLAVGLLVLPGILRWQKAGWHQLLAALAFGIFLLGLTADVGVISRSHIGFVLKPNAPLQLTPTQEGEMVSTLAAGEPVRTVRARGHYIFVRTMAGSGWLHESALGLVCPR